MNYSAVFWQLVSNFGLQSMHFRMLRANPLAPLQQQLLQLLLTLCLLGNVIEATCAGAYTSSFSRRQTAACLATSSVISLPKTFKRLLLVQGRAVLHKQIICWQITPRAGIHQRYYCRFAWYIASSRFGENRLIDVVAYVRSGRSR